MPFVVDYATVFVYVDGDRNWGRGREGGGRWVKSRDEGEGTGNLN